MALLVAAALGWAAVQLRATSGDLRRAQDLVESAVAAVEDGRLAAARSDLDEAERLVIGANTDLYTATGLQLVGWLPVARQNLASLRESVGLAATLIDGGRRILSASAPLEGADGHLEVSLSDGTIPLAAVTDAGREVSALAVQLPAAVPTGGPRFLLGQTRELRDAVHEEAVERRAQLDVLGRGLALLHEVAGGSGPRRYLIAVANTAEMRGSGGMILNYGVLEGRDGVIDLTEFGRIDEVLPPGPVPASLVPPDYLARWSGFDPLSRWRQANLAGDFTIVAPVLEALYESATGQPADGVIQIDPTGLAAILDGVGPVVVPELGQVTGDNVVDLTLNEAYVRFPGVEERSDVLGDVAEAAFRRLVDGEVPSLRTLAGRLAEAVDGRHLLVHAATGRTQGLLSSFGADGAYPSVDGTDAVALTAQNLAGNKLDYHLDTRLRLTGDRPAGQLGTVQAEITLTNTAPPGATAPQYIYGPGPTAVPLPAGVLRSLVTLYLPLGTELAEVTGDATVEPVSTGTEGGRPYAAFIVDVPAGQARTVALVLRVAPRPPGPYVLDVIPSPRVRPTQVEVDLRGGDAEIGGRVEADRRWRFTSGSPPAAVPAPVHR